jgi:hypothetical protein
MATIEQNGGHIILHTGLSAEDFLLLYRTTNTVRAYISSEGIQPLAQISRAVDCVFAVSYGRYLQKHRKNDLTLTLKKQAKEAILLKNTEDTTMEVELELPADPHQLKYLINKQARAISGSMIKDEVAKQMKQLSTNAKQAKNDQRGQLTTKASQKNKKDGRQGATESTTGKRSRPKQRWKKQANWSVRTDSTSQQQRRRKPRFYWPSSEPGHRRPRSRRSHHRWTKQHW